MKVIAVDFTKHGKDIYYMKKELRESQYDLDDKIQRVITYQDLKFRNRLVSINNKANNLR